MTLNIPTAQDMENFGAAMATFADPGISIYLSGTLGAGKTTLVRGFLRGFGYTGKVKSPTFTLVEPYEFESFSVFHFDLYRIESPLELEAVGYREYPGQNSICLIEWPEKAKSFLEPPDLLVEIGVTSDTRSVDISSNSDRGKALITGVLS